METNPIRRSIEDLTQRTQRAQGVSLTTMGKSERLTEVLRELEDPAIWSNPERAQELGRERTSSKRSSARSTAARRA